MLRIVDISGLPEDLPTGIYATRLLSTEVVEGIVFGKAEYVPGRQFRGMLVPVEIREGRYGHS